MTAEELKKIVDDNEAKRVADMGGVNKLLEGLTAAVTSIGDSVKVVVARNDAEEKEKEESKRSDARSRADNFKFSDRKDGENDDDYKKRGDAEEKAYCDAMTEAGEESTAAADKARRDRKDSSEAFEKARKDAADEKEKEKERNDSIAAAGLTKEVLDRIKGLEEQNAKLIGKNDGDTLSMGKAQARADRVYLAFGGSAPRPSVGESLLEYRKRVVVDLKEHSPTWAKAEINVAAIDENLFAPIETQVLDEALKAASDPAKVPAHKIRAIEGRSDSGHPVRNYVGDPKAWMSQFMPPAQHGYLEQNKPGAGR